MIETHIDDARERATAEREALAAKEASMQTFIDRVAGIGPESTSTAATAGAAQGMTLTATGGTNGGPSGSCGKIRNAFAETVQPHSAPEDGGEPLLETIRVELTDSVATALSPETATPLSPELKRAIVSEAQRRQTELEVMYQALDSEAERLAEAAATVEEVTSWLVEADETPLSELGFDALARRHERLAAHRETCQRLAADRQAFLDGTTSDAVETGVRNDHIVSQLYEDFPVEYPVLVTAGRLEELCLDCQHVVRDHLTRRV
ncbi:DUF7260 family protein [Halovenus halobia]|uniref:DUF7260 family protein n=1 Tax=Halovenus halobia TaxID=3396622 RepID=UPI003F55A248